MSFVWQYDGDALFRFAAFECAITARQFRASRESARRFFHS